jgi:RNA polymerase sigma-70 factor (ECF subfamily)
MQPSAETEDIWREFHDRLLAHIRRRVANDHDAEDILQDVFTRIHVNAHRLADVRSVTGWIYGISRNAIIDHYRAQAKAAEAISQLSEEPDASLEQPLSTGQEGSEPSAELARCIEPFLEQLPERYGEAVALSELGGLTQKQAAQQIGLSVSGMKSRVQRGRSKLKDLLLDCCQVELDRRHGVVDYKPRNPGDCGACGCS